MSSELIRKNKKEELLNTSELNFLSNIIKRLQLLKLFQLFLSKTSAKGTLFL